MPLPQTTLTPTIDDHPIMLKSHQEVWHLSLDESRKLIDNLQLAIQTYEARPRGADTPGTQAPIVATAPVAKAPVADQPAAKK